MKSVPENSLFSYRLYYNKKSLLCFRIMNCMFMLKAVFTCKTLLKAINCLQDILSGFNLDVVPPEEQIRIASTKRKDTKHNL
ncbi:Uncharacterised protein [Chlamydia abortus]|nr:Uncharacterised protein [Chlamydia abortus]SHE09294.1 Uncharacterised protein [Chlamydia abortus]